MTTILRYVRVSTAGGTSMRSLPHSLEGVGPDAVCPDGLSRAEHDPPALTARLQYTREDGTLVVTAIDRLGRSVAEVTRTSPTLASDEFCCAPSVKAKTRNAYPRPTGRREFSHGIASS